MITINGKQYPLWSQFIEQKEKWIGGILEDFGDAMDRRICKPGLLPAKTKITDITLNENGKDNACFHVEGEEFSCAFSTDVGGITAGEAGWITFNGYGGHEWRIKQPEGVKP